MSTGRVSLLTAAPLAVSLAEAAERLAEAADQVHSPEHQMEADEATLVAENLRLRAEAILLSLREDGWSTTITIGVLDDMVLEFRRCRSMAAAAGVEVEWDEGDE